MTPTQATVDEDSSGSTNSTEFSGGLFNEKKRMRLNGTMAFQCLAYLTSFNPFQLVMVQA